MPPHPADIPVADRLAVLADPLRLRMVRILNQHELTVGETAAVMQLPQSTVSRHLKALADHRWLTKRAVGTASLYAAVDTDLEPNARAIWQSVADALPPQDPALQEDDRRAAAVINERKSDSRAFFGRIAGAWDDVRSRLFGDHFTAPALLALLPPNATIADFGCGTGNASELLAPWVKQVLAIDGSQAMLDAASKRLANQPNVKTILAEAHDTPLKPHFVSASVAILLLHHIEHPTAVLQEMHRVTEPGGPILIIDMHEHRDLSIRRTMGHHHLGFANNHINKLFKDAHLPKPTITSLPSPPDAQGPGLFAAIARAPQPSTTTPNTPTNTSKTSSRSSRSRSPQTPARPRNAAQTPTGVPTK